MSERRILHWVWRPGYLARFTVAARRVGRVVRARYWFPHIPLALALTGAGYLLLRLVATAQASLLVSDFPHRILDFRPASMPYVLIGVAMLVRSVGLLFRSRFAWIITIVLTASMVRSIAIIGHQHHTGLFYYDGALLLALLRSRKRDWA